MHRRLLCLVILTAAILPPTRAEDAAWVREAFTRRMGRGLAALAQGNAAAAVDDLCWAARRGLNSARANLGCGRALLAARRAEEAISFLELARDLAPEDLGVAIALGDAYLAAGRTAPARAAYYRALEVRVDYSPAYDGLARLALARDDTAAALEFFGKALEANPTDARARLHRGELHLREGRIQQARADIEEAARLRPDDGEVQLGLARILFEAGLANRALATARRARALRPLDARIPALTARTLLSLEALGEAEQQAREAIGLDPDLVEARRVLAEILARTGRIDEAVEQLEVPHPQRLLGRQRRALDTARARWLERREHLAKIEKLVGEGRPEPGETLELAASLVETGQPERAARLAQRALAGPAVDTALERRAAAILYRAGYPLEAGGVLETIDRRGAADTLDLANLALTLELTGAEEAAEKLYRRILDQPDPPAEVHAGLARLALRRGDYETLVRELEAYLAASPAPERAARADAVLERLRPGAAPPGEEAP
ncbi:MAG: tetratricopeptide repeat protein [Acidobacteriota bacterium]|nr:tetratricopeptide repeat protein [Acidobacteriota bacterium]